MLGREKSANRKSKCIVCLSAWFEREKPQVGFEFQWIFRRWLRSSGQFNKLHQHDIWPDLKCATQLFSISQITSNRTANWSNNNTKSLKTNELHHSTNWHPTQIFHWTCTGNFLLHFDLWGVRVFIWCFHFWCVVEFDSYQTMTVFQLIHFVCQFSTWDIV